MFNLYRIKKKNFDIYLFNKRNYLQKNLKFDFIRTISTNNKYLFFFK